MALRQRALADGPTFSLVAALLLRLPQTALGHLLDQQAGGLTARTSPDGLLRVHDDGSGYSALAYVPPGSEEREMPLLLFLHGAGESGSDLDKLIDPGATTPLLDLSTGQAAKGLSENFVVVAPQCPWGQSFAKNSDKLLAFVSYVVDGKASGLHVNPSKLYVTGHSMGGFGAIVLAATSVGQEHAFKALVPVAPAGKLDQSDPDFRKLAGIGVWAFHGENDIVVPSSQSTTLIEGLRGLGVSKEDARLTLVENSPPPPGAPWQTGHGSTIPAYRDYDELWDWILSYK